MSLQRKLSVLSPIWVVDSDGDCALVTMMQYARNDRSQWGICVKCMDHKPFLVVCPLIIAVKDELSLGTDIRQKVVTETLDVFQNHFTDAKPKGAFHTGPVLGMFPEHEFTHAWNCISEVKEKKHKKEDVSPSPWQPSTRKILDSLVHTHHVPFLRFRTYEEVREHCG